MYPRQPSRILHVDGDTFFASCEVALDASLSGKPVWVGGGRRGDGIVIAANREAKRFGIHTGMACFKAKHVCPHGVLARPQYDEYRRLSREMFQIMEQYTPTLVPMSIDEGFLDLTTMGRHVWRDTTAMDYVNGLRARIYKEVGVPVSAGLGRSAWMAKLATSAAKPGFVEVSPAREKEFLAERHVSELAGVGKRRERSLAVLGARTFDDVAKLPSTILKQKFGIWGQQLWLFANGQWNEPLLLEVKDRTTISSSTTLPYDEPDYEAALVFALSESTRMVGQLRREGLQAREMSLTIRFTDFIETGARHRFNHPSSETLLSTRYWRASSMRSWSAMRNRCGRSGFVSGTLNRWIRSPRFGVPPRPSAGARWTRPRKSSRDNGGIAWCSPGRSTPCGTRTLCTRIQGPSAPSCPPARWR